MVEEWERGTDANFSRSQSSYRWEKEGTGGWFDGQRAGGALVGQEIFRRDAGVGWEGGKGRSWKRCMYVAGWYQTL